MIDWTGIRYFSPDEFRCKHCGALHIDPKFVRMLDTLRHQFGKPMKITSGYRCLDHDKAVSPNSINRAHTTGKACDIAVHGEQAYRLVKLALLIGFEGIGVNQKGGSRFIHLDTIKSNTRPNIWSY